MLKNLEKNQEEKLRSRFREHPLLLTCQQAFRHYMASMESFNFTSENLFVEAAIAIDEIFDSPKDAPQYIEDLWDNLKIKLKSRTQPVPSQPDLNIVCSVLFYVIAATMCHHWREYYNKEIVGLLRQIVEKEGLFAKEDEQKEIIDKLCINSEGLEAWINEYEESEEWLTEEIETCLRKRKPEPKIGNNTKHPKDYSKYSFELIPPRRFKGKENLFLEWLHGELLDKHFIADYDININGELAHLVSDTAGKNKLIFNAVFSGKDTDYHILWTGTKVALRYFLSQLKDREVLSWKTGPGIWQITRNRIWYRNNKGEIVQFGEKDFDKGNSPADTTELDKIINFIAPVTKKSKDSIRDEVQEEFNSYSIYEETNENSRGRKLSEGYRDTSHKAEE